MKLTLLVLALGAAVMIDGTTPDGYKRVCYYQKSNRVKVSTIPADLCTHIVFAFAVIQNWNIEPEVPQDLDLYKQLVDKKTSNPGLKVMVSLQIGFPTVAAGTAPQMETFAKNAVDFLRNNNLDGVDFDWEAPKSRQKDGYSKLLKIFRSVIDAEILSEGQERLLFSLALIPSVRSAAMIYDVPVISSVVDFATAMTYDYHVFIKNISEVTAYNSPLFTPAGESAEYSTNATISFYLNAGMDKAKLLLGLATYGRSYTLVSASQHFLHAPASGVGGPGPVYGLKGFYSYQDSCTELKGGTRVWDDHSYVPYLYKGNQWVSYEDIQSANIKSNWVRNLGLGGIGVWSTAWDDYSNMCGDGVFPLITTIKKGLYNISRETGDDRSVKMELK